MPDGVSLTIEMKPSPPSKAAHSFRGRGRSLDSRPHLITIFGTYDADHSPSDPKPQRANEKPTGAWFRHARRVNSLLKKAMAKSKAEPQFCQSPNQSENPAK